MSGKRGSLPLIGLGFFALVAQTLLFRDFVAVFEYNELGIGAFYTTWLFWVGLGAYAGRADGRLHRRLGAWFAPTVLLYVPAFAAQHLLIIHARSLAGIQSYSVFPLAAMFGLLFLVNAPVSLLTGFLFPIGCRWAERSAGLAAARVYTLETLGACAGGLFVTAGLMGHASGQTVFVWACFAAVAALPVAAGFEPRSERVIVLWAVFLALLAVIGVADLPGRLGLRWTAVEDRAEWSRLLPADSYAGSVSTARGRYLYGQREGQFLVISGGGVCDTFPGGEHAVEIAALHIAQNPAAREVLVFGAETLGVCAKFCALPSVARVSWMHPDPEYPETLERLLAARLPAKLEAIPQDIRVFARTTQRRFDIVVLNLPDVTTLALNRYCTGEFFAQLDGILSENGIVGVRVSGGANYVGSEVADPGAVMLATLRHQFKSVVIKPGDETWLIGSNGNGLSQSDKTLSERFSAIKGAPELYPPEALLALYPPDRIQFQMNAYDRAAAQALPGDMLNTDSSPKALKHGLFLALKQAEWRAFSRMLRHVLGAGIWLFAAPVLLYALFRAVYLLKARSRRASLFDSHFVVLSTGLVSMAFSIVLMFVYQSRFNSLFLDIGLVTALFMLGSSAGSAVITALLRRSNRLPARHVMLACVLLQILALLAVSSLPEGPRPVWLALFVLGGFFTGVYFPIVAKQMDEAGKTAADTGAHLELCDVLGGAMGAFATGLFLLPLLGASATVLLLATLVALNLVPPLLPSRRTATDGDWYERAARPCGYTLAGIAVCAFVVSQLAANVQAARAVESIEELARALAGAGKLHKESARRADGAGADYMTVAPTADSPGGYVFVSSDWATRINGYGGPVQLLVYTDPGGTLLNYEVMANRETPAYLRMVQARKARVLGRNLFAPDPFAGVDAVSGATISSNAIVWILEAAGRGFAVNALHKPMVGPAPPGATATDTRNRGVRDFAVLSLLMAAAVCLRFRPGLWRRRALLAVSLIVGGVLLNEQFSMQQVATLAELNAGAIGLTGAFFLLAFVPLAAMLFGNVYCGYVCPFGALQELVGDLVPDGLGVPDKSAWRYARAVKYVFLFCLLLLYAVTRDGAVLRGDLLITLFGGAREHPALILAGVVLVLSLLSPRFWCRNLCPAGAFLSLCNGVAPMRRFMPPRHPRHCDLGVNNVAELDCIHCDRCVLRQKVPATTRGETRCAPRLNTAFIACVLMVFLAAVALSASPAKAFFEEAQKPAVTGGTGRPRSVNVETLKRMIREETLSGREADFYGREEAGSAGPPHAP